MTIGKRILIMTIISLIIGGIGGFIGSYFFPPAPFYFGFFFGFTLSGMVSMFVLAVQIENERTKKQ